MGHNFSITEWLKLIPDDGTFHNLVITFDGTFKTYVDGIKQ